MKNLKQTLLTRLILLRTFLATTKGAMGGKDAIEWVMVLFLVALLGGSLMFVLAEFDTAITDANASAFIQSLIAVFDLLPTWTRILVIVGFAGAIALVGLAIYGVFQKKTSSM